MKMSIFSKESRRMAVEEQVTRNFGQVMEMGEILF